MGHILRVLLHANKTRTLHNEVSARWHNMIVFFQSTTDIRLYKQVTLSSKAGGYII